MNFFLIINGNKIKKYAIIGIALLFAIGVIYIENENVSVFSQDEPSAIYSVNTKNKVVALTFDISWGDQRVGPILQVLEDKNVAQATFFLSSLWSKEHPDIVQGIAKQGFEIGSHGHRHTNYSSLEEEDIRKQIQTSHHILAELAGQPPRLIRLPNGDFDKRVLRIARELDYQVIQWDTDSLDWMNIGVDHIVNRVVSQAHPGDIILMHASDSAEQTHLALPIIIDKLRADGYEFVSVTELLNQVQLDKQEVRDNVPKKK